MQLFSPLYADSRSSSLYSEVEQSIYQIQVVNRKTGNKSVIGSGFVVERGDILATNYHVVSAYVSSPEQFTLNYLSTSGDTGTLELLDVDVLHDLAVLQASQALGTPLETALVPEKGAPLYSLGNPLDLGFLIVPGTNNGLLQNSVDNNILFSGSLNSGMSGGPTLNENGQVVGINVATAGNDVSFLVSVRFLEILLERLRLREFKAVQDIKGYAVRQLHDHSITSLQRLMDNEWSEVQIGALQVPAQMDENINCWDNSGEAQEQGLLSVSAAHCSNEADIHLNETVSVGTMQYQYTWYESEDMIAPRFYRYYELQNSGTLDALGDEENVSAFRCRTRFVAISQKDFKLTVCRRSYHGYKALSDILVSGAMVGESKRGFIFDLYLSGADFDTTLDLLQRMLKAFKWVG